MGVRVPLAALSKGSIFGLHSGFVRARPCSVLLMIIQGDAVVTCTNVYFNRCFAPAQHRSVLRTSSTLANTYGSVVELVDTLVLLKKSTIFLLFSVNECIFIVNYVYYELQGLY